MSETTEYLVENINKTFEVHTAVSRMETEVLSELDKVIRESFSSWVNGEWISPEVENLHEDYCINIIRKEWSFINEMNDIKSYIWAYLQLNGDDPIWKFFGLPDSEKENSIHIHLWLSDEFKQLNNFQKLIQEFDEKNYELLTKGGFVKKGGKVNRYYEKEILFSNDAVLNGLQNNNWDEAVKELIQAWKIFEKIEWDFLRNTIKKHTDNFQ